MNKIHQTCGLLFSRATYRAGLKIGPKVARIYQTVEADVISKMRNKIHETLGPPFSLAVYRAGLESGPKVARIFQTS